jgi:AcrR family transcriptional regulator
MATSRRSRDRRREETLAVVVGALEHLILAGERFTDISVERLARAANMSRTRFYRYFHDKNELLSEWLVWRHDALAENAQRIWDLGRHATPAALREIEGTVHEAYRPQVALMTAVYDAAASDPELRAQVDTIMSARMHRLQQHIELGQAEGWIDPTLLPGETASWLVWMSEWGNHQIALGLAGSDAPAGSLADVFWRVLYAPVRHGHGSADIEADPS